MLRVEQEQAAAEENRKRLVNALRENSDLRARLSDSSASVRRTVLLEDIEDSDSLAPVPAPPPRRRRSSSASLFGDEDPISSLRGRSAVPRSPRRRSASGSSLSTWDRCTRRARRDPRPGRRGAAGRRRRSTTTTRSTRGLRPSGSTITTTRRVVPSTKPPGTPRRSSRRTIFRRRGTSSSALLPRIYLKYGQAQAQVRFRLRSC